MSVYQIEQYYIYLEFEEVSSDILAQIKNLLIDYYLDDFELTPFSINVDGFESEHEANEIEDLIKPYLGL